MLNEGIIFVQERRIKHYHSSNTAVLMSVKITVKTCMWQFFHLL
jgi:hypothetical protein